MPLSYVFDAYMLFKKNGYIISSILINYDKNNAYSQ